MFCYSGIKLYQTADHLFADQYKKPSPITAPAASGQTITLPERSR